MAIRIKEPLLKTDIFGIAPTPMMDWEEIRKAKARCENKCGFFNDVLGSCIFGLMPDLKCKKYSGRIFERRLK